MESFSWEETDAKKKKEKEGTEHIFLPKVLIFTHVPLIGKANIFWPLIMDFFLRNFWYKWEWLTVEIQSNNTFRDITTLSKFEENN